jgi:hypothetical protein
MKMSRLLYETDIFRGIAKGAGGKPAAGFRGVLPHNTAAKAICVLILCLFLLFEVSSVLALDAFPGAEGFGRSAIGGRGGVIYEVTNLSDSGAGSFRAAVIATGPRIVVFRVSGTIRLSSSLKITHPYITIAGQTAPGGGICVAGRNFGIEANDVVIRYMRFRLGDETRQESDTVTISKGHNIILDHCSVSWSIDETLSTDVSTDVMGDLTVQWCMVTQSLNNSIHSKGAHGYGSLIRGGYNKGYSFHHNLYAHHMGRSPRPGNYNGYIFDPCGLIFDFRNNVVYNWGGSHAGYNDDSISIVRMNFINNYYKSGLDSTGSSGKFYAFRESCTYSSACFSGNRMNGVFSRPWDLVQFSGFTTQEQQAYELIYPVEVEPVTTDDALTAYDLVLADAGASYPLRDSADANVVSDVINGTGRIIDCVDGNDFYYPAGYARAGTTMTITLAISASMDDDVYNGRPIEILAGTGAGQIRTITDYVGATRVATVSSSWDTVPDTASQYGVPVDCTKNAGGWPILAYGTPPADSDHDGMPDAWELAVCLNPNDPADRNSDRDSDGYTNIEEYLNWLPSGELMPTRTDVNCDSTVDFYDFAMLAEHWSESAGEPLYSDRYDFDHNDVISMDDLFFIAQDWLTNGQEY